MTQLFGCFRPGIGILGTSQACGQPAGLMWRGRVFLWYLALFPGKPVPPMLFRP